MVNNGPLYKFILCNNASTIKVNKILYIANVFFEADSRKFGKLFLVTFKITLRLIHVLHE